MTGCKTIPAERKIVLPPMPQREELPEAKSVKDLGEIIVKQDALIRSWEAWGKNVQEMIENDGTSNSN